MDGTAAVAKLATFKRGPGPPDDFRKYSVAPTKEDLNKAKHEIFLRANVVDDKYPSINDYLDVQFRLLREDVVSPLRQGFQAFMDGIGKRVDADVYVYRGVKITSKVCLDTGFGWSVQFNVPRYHNWKQSKRLLFGSIVCLFTEDFETVLFATIAERDTDRFDEIVVQFIEYVPRYEMRHYFTMI